jgi:hypothetical protein
VCPDLFREGAQKRGEEGLRSGVCREHGQRHERTDISSDVVKTQLSSNASWGLSNNLALLLRQPQTPVGC